MLSIRDLNFRYKKAEYFTLQGLTLEIKAGERVTVLGPSQSGKSTLALCLNGLIPRLIKGEFQGRIQVGERTTQDSRPRELASRVGVLFQDFESQLISTRVDLEVAFGPENLALSRAEIGARIRADLELVGLSGLADREPATLSGGQKQLLALAAVLALQPQILILDEPTSDLDPWRVEELLKTLETLRQRENLAMVLLGQDLRLTEHSDRIILLNEGKIVAAGKPGAILRQVELFRRLGLQPHPLAALFFDLGQSELPLDLETAATLGRQLGWAQPGPPAATAPSSGPEILALRQVNFGYPGQSLLWKGLSLSFHQGEIVAILGANGSGKTTLLKLLRGLLQPQAGELWLTPDSAAAGEAVRVGFVFQNPDYQIFAEQVREEVAFGPRQLGLEEAAVQDRVDQALHQVHLLDQGDEDPFSLTKGQRQRLAVAAVLAMAPALIILDEPTTGLDHGGQLGMMELIRELNQRGHTIIMVTHSMWAAAAYASRLIVLQEGRIILDGPTREVLNREDILIDCNLFPPLVTRLARLLGFSALTAAEFISRVKGRQHDGRN